MRDLNLLNKIFQIADKNLLCNTSYPVYPDLFQKYKGSLDLFSDEECLSFYIHIPFCKQLCKFCEYTRFVKGDYNHYLDILEKQIDDFVVKHKSIKYINGFDVGGGTPTALDMQSFGRLMTIVNNLESKYMKSKDYEKSIEISLQTIDDTKLKMIADAGFKRISTGIQVINKDILEENGRPISSVQELINLRNKAHELGILKLNLDLMYGMIHQSDEIIYSTLKAIELIKPDHVTLYETRYNMNSQSPIDITRCKQYSQYKLLYDGLIKIGYKARFGQNVFTLLDDRGVSSYLYNRMNHATPYKGFGISAQSMTFKGISYNTLKNRSALEIPSLKSIDVEDNYVLPKEEILGKYICVSLYNGSINTTACSKILNDDFIKIYRDEIKFLIDNKYIYLENDYIYLTKLGFRYYGAIATLFWSDNQIMRLMEEEK